MTDITGFIGFQFYAPLLPVPPTLVSVRKKMCGRLERAARRALRKEERAQLKEIRLREKAERQENAGKTKRAAANQARADRQHARAERAHHRYDAVMTLLTQRDLGPVTAITPDQDKQSQDISVLPEKLQMQMTIDKDVGQVPPPYKLYEGPPPAYCDVMP